MTILEQEKVILEIGYISISFSNFDFYINQLNITLINISNPNIGQIISGELKTDGRMQLCKKLLDVISLDKNLIKKVNDNLKAFDNIRKARNMYLHGIWHIIQEEDVIDANFYLSSIKDMNERPAKKIEFLELQKIKKSLQSIATEQEKLNNEIYKNYHSLIQDNKKKQKLFSENIRKQNHANKMKNGL
jgi:hypothetical protein